MKKIHQNLKLMMLKIRKKLLQFQKKKLLKKTIHLNLTLTLDFESDLDWWPGLADLDRLNITNAPKEDRARLLASKYSKSVDEIMVEIGKRTNLDYQDDFELPENPTKLLPMRLIHGYCCLPTKVNEKNKLCLISPWPPSEKMSRWVFAVSGMKPVWSLGSPEKDIPFDN